jgi:hypothetical protein
MGLKELAQRWGLVAKETHEFEADEDPLWTVSLRIG